MEKEIFNYIDIKNDNNGYSGIIEDVYSIMRNELISSYPLIDRMIEHILARHGKGVRPLFMAFIGKLVGGEWEKIKKAAVIIETIHLASLLHDDVVDRSEFRRGVPTLNARHSDKVSVLFGDYILISAIINAKKIENIEAGEIINNAVKKMVEGEIHDTITNGIIDENRYLEIINAKTASLFAASGELGAVLSGVNGNRRIWAGELGECLGMAFQIIDDTLDYNGNINTMGKPANMDLMSGNMTLPLIYSLRGMSKNEIEEIFSQKDGRVAKLSDIVKNNGGVDYSRKKAQEYINKGRALVSRFGNPDMISVFDNFFGLLINRHF